MRKCKPNTDSRPSVTSDDLSERLIFENKVQSKKLVGNWSTTALLFMSRNKSFRTALQKDGTAVPRDHRSRVQRLIGAVMRAAARGQNLERHTWSPSSYRCVASSWEARWAWSELKQRWPFSRSHLCSPGHSKGRRESPKKFHWSLFSFLCK